MKLSGVEAPRTSPDSGPPPGSPGQQLALALPRLYQRLWAFLSVTGSIWQTLQCQIFMFVCFLSPHLTSGCSRNTATATEVKLTAAVGVGGRFSESQKLSVSLKRPKHELDACIHHICLK